MQRQHYARLAVVVVALACGYTGLLRHLHSLQVGRHEELFDKARAKYTAQRTEKGNRGLIRDVGGYLLAGNMVVRDVLAEPWRCRWSAAEVAAWLAREFGVSQAETEAKLAGTCSPRERYPDRVLVWQRVPPDVARLIAACHLDGISLDPAPEPAAGGAGYGPWRGLQRWVDLVRGRLGGPQDIYMDTACLRGDRERQRAFAVLGRILDVPAARLEELFEASTPRRHLPVEVIVVEGLALDRAERLRQFRDVIAVPRLFNENREHVIEILARELSLPVADLRRDFEAALAQKGCLEVVVAKGIEVSQAERLRSYRFRGLRTVDSLEGLRTVDRAQRYYPKGAMTANLLGFTALVADPRAGPAATERLAGVAGIEAWLDHRLQPAPGAAVYERDRRGAQLDADPRQRSGARDGDNVYLTISEPIQQIVEDGLRLMVEAFAPKAAYAVMVNPRTGAIMAMAQLPSFDPNDRLNMDPETCQNRILLAGFEPGSVMKSVAIAGALDFGVVTLDTVFDCEDGYWVYCRRPLRDAGHAYGRLPVRWIVGKSSNIGTAKIALAMGEVRLFQTLWRFGFGQPTGLGFSNEAPGIFRPLRQWDGLSITRFPIGQGILVTPLQMVQAYNALANDGIMMQLYVVDRIENPVTGEVQRTEPRIKRRTVRPAAAHQVVEAMKLVTGPEGTAPKAALAGYEVAGKTGTAQKVINGQYSSQHVVASFIGFVPADDPAFVLLVVADEPSKGGQYGGTVTAPTFRWVAERTLRYLEVAPAAERATLAFASPVPDNEFRTYPCP